MYRKDKLNYIILIVALFLLTGCESLFGKGKPAYNPRTASIEHRRDEEIFSTFYDVYFDFNSTKINEESMAVIQHIAQLTQQSKPALVNVSGYSDRSGNSTYNRHLSLKRAKAVAKALKSAGVAASLIKIQAYGEDNPSVPTQDDVKILENRRVVIQLAK